MSAPEHFLGKMNRGGIDLSFGSSPVQVGPVSWCRNQGGTRVPFIIKGPGVTSGGRTDSSLVHVVDLFSTMLDLADVPLPATVTLDSKSLKPILANQGDTSRTRLYVEQFDQAAPTAGGRAIRDDRYKLIRFNTGVDQFYDILADPSEAINLLANGIGAMTTIQQAFCYRLRFNLGGHTREI